MPGYISNGKLRFKKIAVFIIHSIEICKGPFGLLKFERVRFGLVGFGFCALFEALLVVP